MTSSVLEMLAIAVNGASNPVSRAEASAKLGVCLAQLGRCEEAKEILDRLRAEYPSGSVPRITIRTMMLDGVIPYYDNLEDSSDRLRRACALATAAGISDLTAEAHVWIAHLGFNFERYAEFGRSIEYALTAFSCLDNSHRARACLLIADGLQYIGERLRANEWYSLARALSRRVHDHALMVAIEYNRLGMGLSRIRVEWAISAMTGPAVARNWLLEIESVRGLHAGFRARALNELLDLCDAYAHEARGQYRIAADLLDRLRLSGNVGRTGVSESLLELELQWCRVMADDCVGQDSFSPVSLDAVDSLSENEKLMGLFFVRSLAAQNGSTIDEQRFIDMLESSTMAFHKSCNEICEALAFVDDCLPSIKVQVSG